ncbi:MAG: DUF6883 domain-containing protein [Solirubrobacteraceae bacterium]
MPPVAIGDLLPRAADAYVEPAKWDGILGETGHGGDFRRVLAITVGDKDMLLALIKVAIQDAPIIAIIDIRDRGPHGVVYGVQVLLAITDRRAPVRTSWHYASAESPPRLVTAYPTP